jgi:hypothetical protein
MDEKLVPETLSTHKTVLEWLTLPECNAAPDSRYHEAAHVFACGLAVTTDLAQKKPMAQAGEAARRAHERHHVFGHKPTGELYGMTLWPGADGFAADCLDCDPFPALGLEYDRGEMEGAPLPW